MVSSIKSKRETLIERVKFLNGLATNNPSLWHDSHFQKKKTILLSRLHPLLTYVELWDWYWEDVEIHTPRPCDLEPTLSTTNMAESLDDIRLCTNRLKDELENIKLMVIELMEKEKKKTSSRNTCFHF